VFVHGFLGSAVDTWQHFQTSIDEMQDGVSWWANCDLYFWQYDSAERSIGNSAFQLREFLKTIIPSPTPLLFILDIPGNPADLPWFRSDPVPYRSVVLVGHSEGGVVIRQAITDAVRERESDVGGDASQEASAGTFWDVLFGADVHLFSPALYGTSFSGLPALIHEIPPARWLFEAAFNVWSPSYKQLKPRSQVLERLAQFTEEYQVRYDFNALKAHIYYGDHDDIVEDLVYGGDPPPEYIANQTHVSVCKPRDGYLEPMNRIRNAASRTVSTA
jgi:hypothetical protein